MNTNSLKFLYKYYCGKYSDGLGFEMLLEKHPEYEGELYMIRDGEDQLVPAEMKFQADETFYDDEVNEMENQVQVTAPEVATAVFNTIADTVTEVNEGEAPKAPSKAEQARAIYAASEDKSRAVVTKRFVEELGLTPAGASTYYQNCKKATAA